MSDTAGVPTDASIRSIINSLLDDFENETDRLIGAFAFLAQTGKQPSDEGRTPEDIVKQLIEINARIQAAAEALRRHQLQQKRLDKLQEAIDQHDRVIFDVALELQKAQNMLTGVLDDAKEKIAVMDAAERAAIDPQELVDYSAFISYTVAPPPNWRDGVYLGPFRSGYPAWASDVVNSTWFRTHYGLADETPAEAPDAGAPDTKAEVAAAAEVEKGKTQTSAVQIVEFDEFDSD